MTDQTAATHPGRRQKTVTQICTKGARLNWPVLLTGMLITLVFSLSIHIVMLQVLRVPYPNDGGVSQWASSLS